MLKSQLLKRIFDVSVSCVALILTAPILLIATVGIWLNLGRPIFFPQRRPGYRGKPFTIYKFRTMSNARDAQGKLLPDEARMTGFGTLLRKLSIDELPELLNVIKGEMSLVGPRPLLMDYLPLYSPEQAERMDVLPGITGLAQINGRNATSWDQRFEYDRQYVRERDLVMDVRILFLTVYKVVRREGISADQHATMPKFEGTRTTPTV